MNIMALRPLSKINRSALQNSRRVFSFKFEMTPRVAQESTSATTEEVTTTNEEQPTHQNFRYNVCQPRTSPVEKPSIGNSVIAARRQMVQSTIEQQHLQPSMLPNYYERKMERSAFINTDPDPSERDKAVTQRKFQVSKTHENAQFPLKSVKLANPFPEPVKMMMSRTVSDDEKAEQMLADSRSQRNLSDYNNRGQSGPNQRGFASSAKRWYSKTVSKDSSKCKGATSKKKKGCPKLKLEECPARARTKCERGPQVSNCKKQQSPYPAYSEFCHEELDEKPSECKMCPWIADEHPTFKPPKKDFHSACSLFFRRTGLEKDQPVKKIDNETVLPAENSELNVDNDENPTFKTPKKDFHSAASLFYRRTGREKDKPVKKIDDEQASPTQNGELIMDKEQAEEDGMLCDLRKPDCQRPDNRRCPDPKNKKKAESEKQKKKQTPKKKASSEENIETIMGDLERPRSVLSLAEDKKGKIKKFRFPKCSEIPERPPRVGGPEDKCPKKKRKRQVVDCPGEGEKCVGALDKQEDVGGYSMKKNTVEKDPTKCPKADLTMEKKDPDYNPCYKPRREGTRICPSDLLEKKPRKKPRRTSGISNPAMNEPPKKEQSQPELTIKPPI